MATKYIHFTEQQKEQARQTDIAEMLRSQGETLRRSGSEYEWRDGSEKVTVRGNLWFQNRQIKNIFVLVVGKMEMRLILSDGFTTKITPKRWSIFLAAVPER